MAGRPEAYVARGLELPTCVFASDRTQDRGGASSEGQEPQESTDGRPQPGQVLRSLRNGLPGGAKLRSGRAGRLPASPVSVGSGRYVRHTSGCVEATGLAPRGTVVPGSCVPGPPSGGRERQRAWRERGKRSRISRRHCAGDSRRANPQGSKWPARAGTAPREGKALEGSSRDASGMKEGREASGATANGGVQKASSEPRASRNRREGQEP